MAADEQAVAATLAALSAIWAAIVHAPADVAAAAPLLGQVLAAGQLRVARIASAGTPPGAVVELAPEVFARATPLGPSQWAAMESAVKVVEDRRQWLGEVRVSRTPGWLADLSDADLDDVALGSGENWTKLVAESALEDTARDVAAVDTAATPKARWIRVANNPCCKRCAILSGKTFEWNEGFKRHPRCGCEHKKYVGSPPNNVATPESLFESGAIRDLNSDERRALDEGGDIFRVVNASRLRRALRDDTPDVKAWWKRKIAAEFNRQARGAELKFQLTPTEIFRHSTDRQEAVRLLAGNGYITTPSAGDVAKLAA